MNKSINFLKNWNEKKAIEYLIHWTIYGLTIGNLCDIIILVSLCFSPPKTHIFSKLLFRSEKNSVSRHSMAVNISVVRVQHEIQYWLWKEKKVSPDFSIFFYLRYFTLSRVNVWNQLKAETFQSGLTFSFWHRP